MIQKPPARLPANSYGRGSSQRATPAVMATAVYFSVRRATPLLA